MSRLLIACHGEVSGVVGEVNQPRCCKNQRPDVPIPMSQVYTSQIHTASVNSLSFAPHEIGLMLASASSDGSIGVISMTEDSQFQEERVTTFILV